MARESSSIKVPIAQLSSIKEPSWLMSGSHHELGILIRIKQGMIQQVSQLVKSSYIHFVVFHIPMIFPIIIPWCIPHLPCHVPILLPRYMFYGFARYHLRHGVPWHSPAECAGYRRVTVTLRSVPQPSTSKRRGTAERGEDAKQRRLETRLGLSGLIPGFHHAWQNSFLANGLRALAILQDAY